MFELVSTSTTEPTAPKERYYTPLGEWQVGSDMCVGRPLSEVAEPYFAAQTAEHYDLVAGLAEQLNETATPAFLDCKSPTRITPVPIATHQEYDHIGLSLAQYRTQDVSLGRISLYCNWPKDSNQRDAGRTIDVIRAFQDRYPELPVAYCMRKLKRPQPIGTLRKTAWDVPLFDQRKSRRTDDILMHNHDADITKSNRGHYRLMDAEFRAPALFPITALFPRLRHQRLRGGHLPNMDTVSAWQDWHQTRIGGYFEMGCGISARGYMAAGGINPDLRSGEVIDLIKRMHQGSSARHLSARAVPAARLETSARRLYEKLAIEIPPEDFWDDDFGAFDLYRTQSPDGITDISPEVRDAFIGKIITCRKNALKRVILEEGEKMGLRVDAKFDRWERIMHLAKVILGGNPEIKR